MGRGIAAYRLIGKVLDGIASLVELEPGLQTLLFLRNVVELIALARFLEDILKLHKERSLVTSTSTAMARLHIFNKYCQGH